MTGFADESCAGGPLVSGVLAAAAGRLAAPRRAANCFMKVDVT
jgi:hypothetical protein